MSNNMLFSFKLNYVKHTVGGKILLMTWLAFCTVYIRARIVRRSRMPALSILSHRLSDNSALGPHVKGC